MSTAFNSTNNEVDTKFTAIGTSGSGKTCYLIGMYNEMAIGVNGFLVTASNSQSEQLVGWIDQLSEDNLYPNGTVDIEDYRFSLSYKSSNLETLQWKDYPGGIILHGESDMLAELEDSIAKSAVLYIFIDGDWLCFQDINKKIRTVKQKCALRINRFIQSFADKNNESLPTIVFIITKRDKCAHCFSDGDDGELEEIIKKSFSPAFTDNSIIYITSVTLGENIESNHEFDPKHTHIPLFIGLYHDYYDRYNILKSELNKKINKCEEDKEKNQKEMQQKETYWFKTKKCKERIKMLQDRIEREKDNIDILNKKIVHHRKLFNAIGDQLLRDSEHFICFENGNKVIFEKKEV